MVVSSNKQREGSDENGRRKVTYRGSVMYAERELSVRAGETGYGCIGVFSLCPSSSVVYIKHYNKNASTGV